MTDDGQYFLTASKKKKKVCKDGQMGTAVSDQLGLPWRQPDRVAIELQSPLPLSPPRLSNPPSNNAYGC